MKIISSLIICLFSFGIAKASQKGLDNYNIVWNSPSANSLESMPCGGGDIGMNVWVEDGDLLIYISRSGTFDELNSFPKLGRIRITMSPNPLENPDHFHQELKLKEGYVEIKARKNGTETTINIWADVFNPVSHIDVTSNVPTKLYATYEGWRFKERVLSKPETEVCRTYMNAPVKAIVKCDTVKFDDTSVLFYHRNAGESAFDLAIKQQKLEPIKDKFWNPINKLTFGGRLFAPNMIPAGNTQGKYASTDYKGWQLCSINPSRKHNIKVVMHTAYAESIDEWLQELSETEKKIIANEKSIRKATLKWWNDFWDRSYIFIDNDIPDPKNEKWQVGRNYQVFRYQLACNAYGSYPTKFNGGLFTTDPEYINKSFNYSPDFRKWGGGSFTAQNQRLVYWPMLKSGDFDMMKSQFDFYNNMLNNAELRSMHYWGHQGACFTEQIENFGLPVGFEYSWKRPEDFDPGVQYNAWIEYQWDTVLEFCMMIIDTYFYNGTNISKYLPLIESCLKFYDEHYQYLSLKRTPKALDAQGKLVLYPSTALETYKMATNPITTVTALKCVSQAMLDLPKEYLTKDQREFGANTNTRQSLIHEMREMQVIDMGQYAHGNQPIQHMIYLYNYAGQPWKTQYWVREVMNRLYQPTPDGYCGDEDNGQTSAWYVMSALGFYSVCPGTDEYVLGAPLFRNAKIHLENGKTIEISAPLNSDENLYISDVRYNGKKYDKNYLNHSLLIKGAKIRFDMDSHPNYKRGTEPDSFPYSFSDKEK